MTTHGYGTDEETGYLSSLMQCACVHDRLSHTGGLDTATLVYARANIAVR